MFSPGTTPMETALRVRSARGTLELALERGPQDRVHHHAHHANAKRYSAPGHGSKHPPRGERNHGRPAGRGQGPREGDPAAGPGRHRLAGPDIARRPAAPHPNAGGPGIRSGRGQAGPEEPDAECRLDDGGKRPRRGRSSVGQDLKRIAPICLGGGIRLPLPLAGAWRRRKQARDPRTGGEEDCQEEAPGPASRGERDGADGPTGKGPTRGEGSEPERQPGDGRGDGCGSEDSQR